MTPRSAACACGPAGARVGFAGEQVSEFRSQGHRAARTRGEISWRLRPTCGTRELSLGFISTGREPLHACTGGPAPARTREEVAESQHPPPISVVFSRPSTRACISRNFAARPDQSGIHFAGVLAAWLGPQDSIVPFNFASGASTPQPLTRRSFLVSATISECRMLRGPLLDATWVNMGR